MSITINARGTSVPYYTIGKNGTTLYQGSIDPSLIYSLKNGDVWLGNTSNSLFFWSTTDMAWTVPKLADFTVSGNTITVQDGSDFIIETDDSHQIKLLSNSIVAGNDSAASADNSLAFGSGASATLYGQRAYANGKFSTQGDAQTSNYILRAETSDATPTELFLDGVSETLDIPVNSVVTFSIQVAARQLTTPSTGAGYSFVGTVLRDSLASSITFVGTPSKTVISEIVEGWDINLSVDTTGGYIKLMATGTASNTIRWVASVQTTQVTN